jgi:hypothetical protein
MRGHGPEPSWGGVEVRGFEPGKRLSSILNIQIFKKLPPRTFKHKARQPSVYFLSRIFTSLPPSRPSSSPPSLEP